MTTIARRLDRLEASDALQSEPATFAQLAEWDAAGRGFEIEPGSRWYSLWLLSLESDDTDASDE